MEWLRRTKREADGSRFNRQKRLDLSRTASKQLYIARNRIDGNNSRERQSRGRTITMDESSIAPGSLQYWGYTTQLL